MASIGRRELLLLLLGMDDPEGKKGLGGITRIQKLLFLLENEEHIRVGAEGYHFEPYKAGPYSPKIYDDLEFLENLDLVRRDQPKGQDSDELSFQQLMGTDTPQVSAAEEAEVDLGFEELMGPETVMDDVSPTPDSYEEARYFLTPSGKQKIEELLQNGEYRPFAEGIHKVKSRFANYSLSDLLYYVYTRYPQMTTESEIKEKVLRRRPT